MRADALTFRRARRLRRTMSLPEVILWRELRHGALAGLEFRRQHPVGPFILDFYCVSRRLAVEVDGAGHDHPSQEAHDVKRDAWLAERGIRVLRLPAKDVLDDGVRAAVLEEIVRAAGR